MPLALGPAAPPPRPLAPRVPRVPAEHPAISAPRGWGPGAPGRERPSAPPALPAGATYRPRADTAAPPARFPGRSSSPWTIDNGILVLGTMIYFTGWG